jgi:hypothetical protein
MTEFEGIETKEMLGEIDNVVKHHLTQQMNKIIKENSFLKENVSLLKKLPIIKKYEDDINKLRNLNTLLVKKLKKTREKLEEYENYANLNLEIKEITRDPSQILQLDNNNWQKLILQNDMSDLGVNDSDEDEDEESRASCDGEDPISIEHDIAAEDNEISDDEESEESGDDEEVKEWVWAETGDKYFIEDPDNGKIFENIDGKVGKEVGRLEEGVAFFS